MPCAIFRPKLIVAAAALVAIASSVQAQDAEQGAAVFKRACAFCHSAGAERGVLSGPPLAGVFDQPAGRLAGYPYSEALRKSRLVWNAATLDKYLADPRALVPGANKRIAGIANAADRASLIAYLQTLK